MPVPVPPTVPSAAETAAALAAALAALTDTCRTGRITAGAYAVVATGVLCRMDFAGKNIEEFLDIGVGSSLLFALQVPIATSLLAGDQIDKGGQYFYVNDTDKGRTGAIVLTAYCVRVVAITW